MLELTLGEHLKDLREAKRMTLKELGEAVEISPSNLSDYENGNKNPSLDYAKKLAIFYGVSLNYLAGIDKFPTHEDTDISKATGLTDLSISALKGLMNSINGEYKRLIYNKIITSPLFADFIEHCEFAVFWGKDISTSNMKEASAFWQNKPVEEIQELVYMAQMTGKVIVDDAEYQDYHEQRALYAMRDILKDVRKELGRKAKEGDENGKHN